MSEIKNYLVNGWYKKGIFKYKFSKQVRSVSPEIAAEKVISFIAGNHKVRKNSIKIVEIVELSEDDISDRTLQYFISR